MSMVKGAYSVSLAQGRVAHEHDMRDYQPKNADRELSSRNVVICETTDYQEAFNDIFRDSIVKYNAGQVREDRKKSLDYYSEIVHSPNKEKPIYEYVMQIGCSDDNGITDSDFDVGEWQSLKDRGKFLSASNYVKAHLNKDPRREELKGILIEQLQELQDKYPNFKFLTIVVHDDEVGGTCHAHIAFTPIAYGYKNGMEMRTSLSKALSQMGFESDGKEYPIQKWQNKVKDDIENAMVNAGYERAHLGNNEKHLSVSQFKLKCENERIAEENAYLREANKNYEAQLAELNRRTQELDEREKKVSHLEKIDKAEKLKERSYSECNIQKERGL